MLKKITSLFLLLATLYILAVFFVPSASQTVDTLIGKPWLTQNIQNIKKIFDGSVTDIPSVSEFKSGAVDIQQKFTQWVDTTKQTIDTVREWVQKVEEGYTQIQDTYWAIQESLSGASDQIQKIQGTIDSLQDIPWNSNSQTQ